MTNPLGAIEERVIDALDRVVSSTRTGVTSQFHYEGDTHITLGMGKRARRSVMIRMAALGARG